MTSRSVAYAALLRIEQDGAYANLVLPALLRRSKLDTRDRAFVTDLVYGTTRMRRACDSAIDRFVVSPPEPACAPCSGSAPTSCCSAGSPPTPR